MVVEAVARLRAALDDLRAFDVNTVSAADLVESTAELLKIETGLRAEELRWLSNMDERDTTTEECGRAPRSWLIEEHNLSPAEAARRMRIARTWERFPDLRAAAEAGAITMDHVATILDAIHGVPAEYEEAMVAALLKIARDNPPHLIRRLVDDIREALGIDRTSDEKRMRRYAERFIGLDETFGGAGSLAGTLTPEMLEKARLGLESTTAFKCAGPDDKRTVGQRRHDALEEVFDFWHANKDLPASCGERTRVVVTIPLESLLDELSTTWGILDSGLPVSPQTARRLACDGDIVPAVLGSRSEVLDIGRATSVWTIHQRRAVTLRDGQGCAFPRCTRPPADLHHIVWWSLGGRTSVDNACWLCAYHHRLVHEDGWSIRREANGHYTWTSPRGVIRSGPPPRHRQAA